MIPLPYLTLYRIRGADAAAFLQAQLAADTASLGAGASGFAAWCSPRGQVIALLLVCREGDDWLLACEARLADPVFSRLRRYVLRARVEIEPLGGTALAGLPAGEVVTAGMSALEPRQSRLRYAIVNMATVPEGAYTRGTHPEPWRAAELKHGVAWLQPATSERFLPQMLGLDQIGAVSFSKGCYPGQEIVARTRYLGKLKRKPVLLEVQGDQPIPAGEPCTVDSTGQAVDAVIIEAAASENAVTLVLVVAPLEEEAPVGTLTVAGRTWTARRVTPVWTR
ncbi:MAG: YgfZ/GcvT domain-containing protein [Lysobacterales bacterium]